MKYFGDAVILCGGKSKRMDVDKAFIKLNGKYIIDIIYEKLTHCFDNVRLCVSSKEKFEAFDIGVIEDSFPKVGGPAVGIYSSLKLATSKYVFVTACDMPLVNCEYIEFLKEKLMESHYIHDAILPMKGEHVEPLYSFYSSNILDLFEIEINKGNYKINSIVKNCNTLYINEDDTKKFDIKLNMFENINYMEDLEKLICLMK